MELIFIKEHEEASLHHQFRLNQKVYHHSHQKDNGIHPLVIA